MDLQDIPTPSEEEQELQRSREQAKKQRELENLLMEDYINKFTPREQAIIDIVIERMTRDLLELEEYIADIRYHLDEMYGAVSNAENSASYTNNNSNDMVEHVDEELEARELKKRLKDLENETKDPSHG